MKNVIVYFKGFSGFIVDYKSYVCFVSKVTINSKCRHKYKKIRRVPP